MAAATFPTTLQRLLLPALQQQPFPTLARPLSSQILANGFLRFGIPTLSIPSLSGLAGVLEGLWDSVLRAVPKKKTTHSKSRSRRLAGKALKDLINIGRCSACGRPKLSHTLCPHCVQNIKDMWAGRSQSSPDRVTNPREVFHRRPRVADGKRDGARLMPTKTMEQTATGKGGGLERAAHKVSQSAAAFKAGSLQDNGERPSARAP